MEFFKSNWATYITTFLLGFLCCLYMTKSKCVSIPENIEFVDTGGWVEHSYDTVVQVIEKEVPVPYVVTKKVVEVSQWLIDSLKQSSWSTYVDSLVVDSNLVEIDINHYEDSIQTDKYKLTWKAETFGFLTSMVPEVEVYCDSIIVNRWHTKEVPTRFKPRWTIGAGVSNRLNYKFSAGYKGFLIETEFHDKFKFNQVYLTKQFSF